MNIECRNCGIDCDSNKFINCPDCGYTLEKQLDKGIVWTDEHNQQWITASNPTEFAGYNPMYITTEIVQLTPVLDANGNIIHYIDPSNNMRYATPVTTRYRLDMRALSIPVSNQNTQSYIAVDENSLPDVDDLALLEQTMHNRTTPGYVSGYVLNSHVQNVALGPDAGFTYISGNANIGLGPETLSLNQNNS